MTTSKPLDITALSKPGKSPGNEVEPDVRIFIVVIVVVVIVINLF